MTDSMSRRRALQKLGLLALVGYAAPTVLELPGASAEAKSRSRKRSAPKRKKAKGRKAKG